MKHSNPKSSITRAHCNNHFSKLFILFSAIISADMPSASAQETIDVSELPGVIVTAPANQQSEPYWVKPEKVLQGDDL
ncbi:hypothetical protein SAMN05216302_102041 [Nitrosomonas aestuarii]|uniref:Uncharacterized protein n=1 Tax=Nitrosomonas aestuarii TaxID=52441 RepID=A0A1I4DCQ0_9PROT|nr:hypothetical protein SAMN05216302_102041 [Nitrosomonas aestuarii]